MSSKNSILFLIAVVLVAGLLAFFLYVTPAKQEVTPQSSLDANVAHDISNLFDQVLELTLKQGGYTNLQDYTQMLAVNTSMGIIPLWYSDVQIPFWPKKTKDYSVDAKFVEDELGIALNNQVVQVLEKATSASGKSFAVDNLKVSIDEAKVTLIANIIEDGDSKSLTLTKTTHVSKFLNVAALVVKDVAATGQISVNKDYGLPLTILNSKTSSIKVFSIKDGSGEFLFGIAKKLEPVPPHLLKDDLTLKAGASVDLLPTVQGRISTLEIISRAYTENGANLASKKITGQKTTAYFGSAFNNVPADFAFEDKNYGKLSSGKNIEMILENAEIGGAAYDIFLSTLNGGIIKDFDYRSGTLNNAEMFFFSKDSGNIMRVYGDNLIVTYDTLSGEQNEVLFAGSEYLLAEGLGKFLLQYRDDDSFTMVESKTDGVKVKHRAGNLNIDVDDTDGEKAVVEQNFNKFSISKQSGTLSIDYVFTGDYQIPLNPTIDQLNTVTITDGKDNYVLVTIPHQWFAVKVDAKGSNVIMSSEDFYIKTNILDNNYVQNTDFNDPSFTIGEMKATTFKWTLDDKTDKREPVLIKVSELGKIDFTVVSIQ